VSATTFVGTVTRLLADQGYDPRAIRAEEFGNVGENATQGGTG
jgi:hypothetical protein